MGLVACQHVSIQHLMRGFNIDYFFVVLFSARSKPISVLTAADTWPRLPRPLPEYVNHRHIVLTCTSLQEVLEYFRSLNINIYEVYGMSECTGPEVNHPCL